MYPLGQIILNLCYKSLEHEMISQSLYYKDLLIGSLRNYIQPLWSTKYDASQITDNLYISDLATAYNKDMLKSHGITHVISMILGINPMFPEDFTYKNLHVQDIESEDLSKYFDECSDFIEDAIKKGGKVLVHCSCGISRSASIIIAYLISKHHMCFSDAYALVKSKRSIIEPNNGFVEQLINYENKLQR